jgi:hypothetical protein
MDATRLQIQSARMVSVLIALLAVTGTWSAIAAASVRKPPSGAGTLVLHPVFRHAGAVAAVLADDRYAFAHAVFTGNGDRFGVAVDERTGNQPRSAAREGVGRSRWADPGWHSAAATGTTCTG